MLGCGLHEKVQAKRYFVRGRVQGVGFRNFVQKRAVELGVKGYAMNLDDGQVEIYAIGTAKQIAEFEGYVWTGPRWAEVRGVEAREEALLEYKTFQIR